MIFINKGRKIDTNSIRKRLAKVMEAQELSDYKVADMTGLKRAMVAHLRTGRREFTIETACEICKGLDIDIIWFITGVENK